MNLILQLICRPGDARAALDPVSPEDGVGVMDGKRYNNGRKPRRGHPRCQTFHEASDRCFRMVPTNRRRRLLKISVPQLAEGKPQAPSVLR